ncbi:hypothetical protein VZT92_021180 [Zoarces viviparus]|uniref:Uncharacterized protein n=1 Tax=Zoarces viviparus TaxID=48416 RepID=A0AAW1EGP6_ZOAVI
MSDEEEGAAAPWAGPSHHGDNQAAAMSDEGVQNASSEKGTIGVRFKIKPGYTDDGQPICLQWKQEPPIAVSQAMRGKSKDSQDILTKERFLERAVGKCPEVDIQIGGVPLRNTIQDAWGATVYKVVDIQGTTYAVETLEGGPVKRVHRSNLRPYVGPIPAPRRRHQAVAPVDELTLSPESETEFSDPEFILVEEVYYPATKGVATQERENLDLTEGLESHLDNVADGEDLLGLEGCGSPDDDLEEKSVPCPQPMSERPSSHVEDLEVRPVPTPRKRKEGNADLPIPPLRSSRRKTAGIHQNPFNLPSSSCNAMSFSPDVLSQLLAGMVFYTSKLQGNIDRQEVTEDIDW